MTGGPRELRTGDLVEIPRQFGRYVVVGAKSWKTLWVRPQQIYIFGGARPTKKLPRQAAARKKLRLVTPVEERLADLLMRGEG